FDAYKITGSSENVSLKRGGKLLSVERHHTIAASDTFFLNVTNLKAQTYQWQLNIENMNHPGLNGYLEDHYVNTSTALDLNGTNAVDFTVNSAPASYAPDRFAVVFSQPKVLATTFADLKAYRQNADIIVDWNVENETDMKQYEVEKSLDGTSFTNMNTTLAKNANTSAYSWTDDNAQVGYNYYRIKSINAPGKIEYSKVVKVFIEKESSKISVYPNPIVNGIINLQLSNQPAGTYGVRLLNGVGQVIVSKQVDHADGSSVEKIKLNKNSAHGIYQIEVTKPGGSTMTINVIN
ncbi:MAG: T9SS type A sorting domain-containing protein, partial [Ginsengibacter sp.]